RAAGDILGTKDYTKRPGLGVLIESLAEQGRIDEAEGLLAEFGMDAEVVPNLFSVLPLLTRGKLRAAAGDYVRARADLDEALRWMRLSRGLWPRASDACVALVAVLCHLGEQDAARAAVEQAMQAATGAQSRRRLRGAPRGAARAQGGTQR